MPVAVWRSVFRPARVGAFPNMGYRCRVCGVLGHGDACWCCGSVELEKAVLPANGHRHDLGCRQVSVAGEMLAIGAEADVL